MRFGATGLMRTLMRVLISSDAPRCTVQFGALDPRCTMVQVHGDPNEPSLGAGAAGAPCVTLLPRAAQQRIAIPRCSARFVDGEVVALDANVLQQPHAELLPRTRQRQRGHRWSHKHLRPT